jgi:hypothetical protein
MAGDNISFPWWFLLLGWGAESAPLAFPLVAVAAILYFCFERRHVFRVALVITSVPAVISLMGVTYFYGGRALQDHEHAVFVREHTRILSAPLRIGPVRIPAGVSVTDAVYPPQALEVHASTTAVTVAPGALVRGEIEVRPDGPYGDALLLHDALINGVPCAAGPVNFTWGPLHTCTLGRTYRIANITFHRDTGYDRLAGFTPAFTVGSAPPSIRVAGHRLPEGTTVTVFEDQVVIERPHGTYRGGDRCSPFPPDISYDIGTGTHRRFGATRASWSPIA